MTNSTVLLRCLVTGKLYPDPADCANLRYAAEGDIIYVTPEEAVELVANGFCEKYEYIHRQAE